MVLQIRNLTKIYNSDVFALLDVSCSMQNGIVAVIGPNAAGKTTLLKILAGLEEASSGEICLNGLNVAENRHHLRSAMGYLPQKLGFHPKVNGEDVLNYIAALKGILDDKIRRQCVDEVIDMVNLSGVRKLNTEIYSFGMKRRLGIAQALLGKPPIFILDEPFEGLDPEERTRLGCLLTELSEQRLIIISTHSLSVIELNFHSLLVLRQGRLLYQGPPVDLISLADRLVWQMEIDFGQIEMLKRSVSIVDVYQKSENLAIVRVLSTSKPTEEAVQVAARLTDGYFVLMNVGV